MFLYLHYVFRRTANGRLVFLPRSSAVGLFDQTRERTYVGRYIYLRVVIPRACAGNAGLSSRS